MIDGAFASRPPPAQEPYVPPSQIHQRPTTTGQTHQTVRFPSTTAEFDSLISSSSMAIAFFTSETCGPCKMIEPQFQSLSRSYSNIVFIHVDTQKQFAIARTHQISATPTFKTFLNGQILSEWKGANISALDSNVSRLLEAARPPLPPHLRGSYSQSPILFPRAPPLDKVLPKLPAVIPKPLLERISKFLAAKGNTDVLVPPLVPWSNVQKDLDYNVENAWMVVDLLRAGMADKRISGWFAVDGLDTITKVVKDVNIRDEGEWQLRVVTVQLVPPLSVFR
jgi:desumoylating isopeptidase 1